MNWYGKSARTALQLLVVSISFGILGGVSSWAQQPPRPNLAPGESNWVPQEENPFGQVWRRLTSTA